MVQAASTCERTKMAVRVEVVAVGVRCRSLLQGSNAALGQLREVKDNYDKVMVHLTPSLTPQFLERYIYQSMSRSPEPGAQRCCLGAHEPWVGLVSHASSHGRSLDILTLILVLLIHAEE